jgi:hypothetical protein
LAEAGYRDGMGPRVPLYLTDHAPRGYRPPARPDYRLSDAEASRHRRISSCATAMK